MASYDEYIGMPASGAAMVKMVEGGTLRVALEATWTCPMIAKKKNPISETNGENGTWTTQSLRALTKLQWVSGSEGG